MSQYFPKPYESFGGDIDIKVDLSNYATKTDLQNISHIDVSSYALKSNLASLKTEVDKLHIDKLTSVPDDLAKLSNVVKNNVIKKTEYDKLVNKVHGIDNINFVSKAKYEKDGSDFEDKISNIDKNIPDVSALVKKSALTAVENKIRDLSGLATSSALSAVKNKIPDISSLVTKTDFDAKVIEIEGKIPSITGLATNLALTAIENKIPNVTSLVTKTYFDAKLKAISDRVTKNKTKDLLLNNELKKKTFDTDYFVGGNYFEGDNGAQNTLVFQVESMYFRREVNIRSGNVVVKHDVWKSKGISDQSLYYTKFAITAKLIRPTHVVLGADGYFFKTVTNL